MTNCDCGPNCPVRRRPIARAEHGRLTARPTGVRGTGRTKPD